MRLNSHIIYGNVNVMQFSVAYYNAILISFSVASDVGHAGVY